MMPLFMEGFVDKNGGAAIAIMPHLPTDRLVERRR
jgi:hypothetical protein